MGAKKSKMGLKWEHSEGGPLCNMLLSPWKHTPTLQDQVSWDKLDQGADVLHMLTWGPVRDSSECLLEAEGTPSGTCTPCLQSPLKDIGYVYTACGSMLPSTDRQKYLLHSTWHANYSSVAGDRMGGSLG